MISLASSEVRKKSLPPKAAWVLRLGGLAQPAPGASEPPNMNNRDPSWAGSLKSYPKWKGKSLSPIERMVGSTISEWYWEKHRRLFAEEEGLAFRASRIPLVPLRELGLLVPGPFLLPLRRLRGKQGDGGGQLGVGHPRNRVPAQHKNPSDRWEASRGKGYPSFASVSRKNARHSRHK